MKKQRNNTKTWFITGASSGVGYEFCKQLLEQGDNVIAVARRVPDFNNENALCLSVDVTDHEAVQIAIEKAFKRFGIIDVLVNNAGKTANISCEHETLEHMKEVMNVNFFGTFNTMNVIMPYFRKQRHGTILNNTSMHGITVRLWGSAYCSSKHAIEGLTGVARLEAQKFCRVAAFELGWFPGTELVKQGTHKIPKKTEEYLNLKTPYNYINDNKSISNAVKTIIKVIKENDELPRHFMVGLDSISKAKIEISELKKNISYSSKFINQYSDYNPYKDFIQKIFSIKNDNKKENTRKIITILGIKFKFKMKKKTK